MDGPVNWQCPASFDDAEQIEHILHPPCVVVLILTDVCLYSIACLRMLNIFLHEHQILFDFQTDRDILFTRFKLTSDIKAVMVYVTRVYRICPASAPMN